MKTHQSPVVPSDCVVAVGIPTSRERFSRQVADRTRHDFVPALCGDWARYEPMAQLIQRYIGRLTSRGVGVVHHATLERFRASFANRAVVILIAHSVSKAVEFDDGLAPIERVVSAVPPEFSGVLDLCVCHPTALVLQLRRDRPACLIKRTRAKARLSLWLQFYDVLFETLQNRSTTYTAAMEQTIRNFIADEQPAGHWCGFRKF